MREELEHGRFFDESRRVAGARTKLAVAEGVFGLVVNATTALGTAAVLFIGAKQVESIDAAPYENASIIHDMNFPLPGGTRYSMVLDFGCLEHVFNGCYS